MEVIDHAESPLGVLTRYWAGRIQYQKFDALQGAIRGQIQQEVSFHFRRGCLSLFEGDTAAAKERFTRCRITPPPGWGIGPTEPRAAVEYLRMIEAAEKK